MNFSWSAPPSVLAFASTVHLAMVVLRAHRAEAVRASRLVPVISLLFAGSPWLMPSAGGLVAGFVVHLVWFIACERLLTPAHANAPAPSPSLAPRRAVGIAQMARKPRQFVQTRVLDVFDETPDTRTFRMARPEGFGFKAGQFLTVRVRVEDREYVRCYSISSPPEAREHLEVSVKRIGLVSGVLHATVRPGSMMSVRAPAGAFVYPADDDRPLVLIAGGVGITPLRSMLRHAIEAEPTRPVTLFYSVRTVDDIAFRDELTALSRQHPHVRVFFAVTAGVAGEGYFPGRINESLLTTTVPDIAQADCLMCGPQPMLDAMTTLLTSLGVPRAQITYEVFQAAVAASGGAAALAAEPAPAAIGRHHLQFDRSHIETDIEGTQTMLDAAESCGAPIPSLCRMGVCGTCRTRVISGAVQCTSRTLDEQDRQEGFVLACVTHVLGDCTVDV